jgi:cysteine-rich repeat protein
VVVQLPETMPARSVEPVVTRCGELWRRRGGRYRAAALIATLVLLPQMGMAHGMRLPFGSWGGFAGDTLRCQRLMARAVAECAETAWSVRRECREGALDNGSPCTPDDDPRISAARAKALNTVSDVCSSHILNNLQFLDYFIDVQPDVTNFCRHVWPDAADSLVFVPALSANGDAGRRCASAAGDAASDVMQYVFRSRRRCMDRTAAMPPSSPDRAAILTGAAHGFSAALQHVSARLAERCPEMQAIYQRSAGELVDLLAQRADCLGGAFYIQDAVICPAPVCGNGIVEFPETCDDGNTADGDGCPSTCDTDS